MAQGSAGLVGRRGGDSAACAVRGIRAEWFSDMVLFCGDPACRVEDLHDQRGVNTLDRQVTKNRFGLCSERASPLVRALSPGQRWTPARSLGMIRPS
jgi:hypothetical protein